MDNDILINCSKCDNILNVRDELYTKFRNEESNIKEEARKKLILERENYRIHLEHKASFHELELKIKNEEIAKIRKQLNKKNKKENLSPNEVNKSPYHKKKNNSNLKTIILTILTSQIILYILSFGVYVGSDSVPWYFLILAIFLDFFLIFNLITAIIKIKAYKFAVFIYSISTLFMLLSFSLLYADTGVFVDDSIKVFDLKSSFYFSVITWTSLGYGDIFPTLESRKWVMTEVFFGYVHMGILVGLLLDYITNKTKRT